MKSEYEVQQWLKAEAAARKAQRRQNELLEQGVASLRRYEARKAAARKGSIRGAAAFAVALCLKMFGA